MKTNEIAWIEWYDENKAKSINDKLNPLKDLLQRNRLLLPVLTTLIKEEIANNVETEVSEEIRIEEKDILMKTYNIDASAPTKQIEEKINNYFLTLEKLDYQVKIEGKCREWSRIIWGEDIPSIYIERKDSCDIVSFRIMRFEQDKAVYANEIYHKIKNDEITFKEAAIKYGSEEDRLSRAKVISKPLNKLSKQLLPRLQRLKKNELSLPFKMENWIIMAQLLDIKISKLDNSLENKILKEKLDSFVKYGALKIASYLHQTTTN